MKSIELFVGAGGLGMGIAKAGFSQLLGVERDNGCIETIKHNQNGGVKLLSGWNVEQGEVGQKDFTRYEGKIDLVSGGPPCQPFSNAGKHLADLDYRDSFPDAIQAIQQIKPKAFILENVKGLTRKSLSNYLEYIKLHLSFPELMIKPKESWIEHLKRLEREFLSNGLNDLGYKVVSRVLNAADYGIPQKRERLFIVGFRSDLSVEWNFPSQSHSLNSLNLTKKSGEYWEKHKVKVKDRTKVPLTNSKFNFEPENGQLTEPWTTIRDAIKNLPEPYEADTESGSILNHEKRLGARMYKGHTGSFIDEPAKTIKAGVHGVPGGENMIRYADNTVRYFTVRESMRFQTFPDQFSFSNSWSKSMYQIGNAVPVELARILAESISNSLKSIDG